MIANVIFEKISIEKKKDVVGNIEAKNNVKITEITEQPVDIIGEKQPLVSIKFTFSINYEPDIATLEIAGKVLDMVTEKEKKAILDLWKKEERLEPAYATTIMNTILTKCNIKALVLGAEVNLPSHIPMPRLSKNPQQPLKKAK